MNDQQTELPDSLRLKFPGLRPVKRAPALITVNGIGLSMRGRRDADIETGTYVKTRCVCLVFIPLLALDAYRVADAEKGWYFLGKERLSSFAKSWNLGVLLLALVFTGMMMDQARKSSPNYLAGRDLQRAGQAMKAGRALEAARIYRDIAVGQARTEEGRAGLQSALEQCLTNPAPEPVEGAFRLLAALPPRLNSPAPVVPEADKRGLAAIERFRNRPEAALGILRQVALLGGPTNTTLQPLEIDLLQAAIAANPGSTNRVVELALIYESRNQLDQCYRLLTPYRKKLGATEGARILGRHLLETRQYQPAYELLYPYVEARLAELRAIEKRYTNALATAYKRAIDRLNNGEADRSFYDKYEKAPKAERDQLVEAATEKWLRQDAALQRAVNERKNANRIVNVTLELGIVQLNRAQSLADPAARKTELEAAEKTFLAIRGMADDTDEYRMFLGQVYYWLGKSAQGRELFDQLLAAHQRAYPILIGLAHTLREVGEENQARELYEEAYRTAKSDKEKFAAASARAHAHKDIDDEIAWFEKADPNETVTQIGLNTARGDKALRDGNRELAAQSLRQAIARYESLPRTSVNLNNCGLVWLSLYRATGDLADHNRGLSLFEQAIDLEPGNSVLLLNIAHLMSSRAYMDVVGEAIHFDALKEAPGHAMLAHLYKNEQERAEFFQRLRQTEHMQKALAYLDKALLLAPKNHTLYSVGLQLQAAFRDLPELQKLQQRLRLAAPDLAEIKEETRKACSGAKDKEHLERLQGELRRYETLLQSPAVAGHAPTLAFAQLEVVGLRQGAAALGAAVDSRQILSDALAAHQQRPTTASLATLVAAHLFRAHDELKRQSSEYAQLAESTRHALAPRHLLAFLLEQDRPAARLIRQNADVIKALELVKETARLFPSLREIDEWALFRTIDPAETARLAAQLKADAVGRLTDELQYQLNPFSATAVLEQYWTRKMNGDEPGARQLYQQALNEGVPLPPL